MDDGTYEERAKGRCLEVARARLELALDAAACEPPAEREVLHDHPAAPRIHHPHQLGLVSAGSSRAQQSAPASGGVRRMRWTTQMNQNALRAYFRAKGGETGGLAYRARMQRLFAELEPSLTVTEQNLADRVRYILRANIFDGAELERLRREAVPSSDENATAEGAVPQIAEQPANVDAAVNTPVWLQIQMMMEHSPRNWK
ncbi:unnamed protein product [Parnassius apollo]|uniref:(apollo) hypothetical protein n=1 Tax=Parnassius apollo TaxID=110799 RepID=A0A8S3WZE0_PARAO|nr:unnamed protein product [Parnassius apollo]